MRIIFLETHPMWIHGLPNGFREAGHEVMVPEKVDKNNIQNLVNQFQPNLAFAISWTPTNVAVESQHAIHHAVQNANIPLIYWDTEGPIHFESDIVPLVKRMQPSFVFTIYPNTIPYYLQLGYKAAFLEFGYHSQVHFPVSVDPDYVAPVALIANSYYNLLNANRDFYRLTILKQLLCPIVEMGLPINFYGNNWGKMGELLGFPIPAEWNKGYLPYELANKVYSSAEIILGPQNEPGRVSQRTYEILASGGFLLTVDTPGTRAIGVPGQDFISTHSHEQTKELVEYYLSHPEERREIQKNGQLVVANHSYRNRADYILDVLRQEKIITH